MFISRDYTKTPNFGSVKLCDLTLRKKLPNGLQEQVSAELHKLDVLDFSMIENLYAGFSDNVPTYFTDIRNQFVKIFSPKNKKISHNKIFLMVKQNDRVNTICVATMRKKEVFLDFISNLDRANGVKGAGTSIIVKLAELAKKLNKPAVTLEADPNAVPFYKKLGFVLKKSKAHLYTYTMENEALKDFLSIFKPKYFHEK